MKNMVDKIMRTYGTPLTLYRNGEKIGLRGFLQPNGSRSWQNTEINVVPLGIIPNGQYLYIGPVTPAAEEGDVLIMDNRIYELRQSEPVMYRDQLIYRWGLCVEKGGEDKWGSTE